MMKKIILLVLFIVIGFNVKADNIVTVTPFSQFGSGFSNDLIFVNFSMFCSNAGGNNNATSFISINTSGNPEGLTSLNYPTVLFSNTSGSVLLSFQKTVTQTTTVNYNFHYNYHTPQQQFGFGSGSFGVTITYFPNCLPNITITQNVNFGQTDIQESSNTITARNTIFNNATAEYDAGNAIFLKPNFHAKNGSSFRAYIEGCQNAKSGKKQNEYVTVKTEFKQDNKEFIKAYPNPTKNYLFIESDKDIMSWTLTNTFGKLYYKGFKNKKKVDMSYLPNGIYFLKAISISGQIITKTIIKN